jgi:hypothetical protein
MVDLVASQLLIKVWGKELNLKLNLVFLTNKIDKKEFKITNLVFCKDKIYLNLVFTKYKIYISN